MSDTEWTRRDDEELAELMELYPTVEPAIERSYSIDAELQQLRQRLDSLERQTLQRLAAIEKRVNSPVFDYQFYRRKGKEQK